jgi:SET domain-containing protein
MGYEFHYKRNGVRGHACALVCDRCTEMTKNGTRCKMRTCQSLPVCHVHLGPAYKLKIKDSQLHGRGLFAHAPRQQGPVFRKGETIVEYRGEQITAQERQRRYLGGTAPYGAASSVPGMDTIDAACWRSIGSNANGSRGQLRNNARFSVDNRNRRTNVKATRDIYHGDEIIVSYQAAYWAGHHNVEGETIDCRKNRRRCLGL